MTPRSPRAVVADPWLGVDLIDRFYWYENDIKVHVTPIMGAVNESIAAGPGWDELKTKTGGQVHQQTHWQQWVCHSDGKFLIFFEPPLKLPATKGSPVAGPDQESRAPVQVSCP